MRIDVVVISVAFVLSMAVPAAQVRDRSADEGPWRPWDLSATATARQTSEATPAEVKALETRMQALRAIIMRAPAVARPIGFAGYLSGALGGRSATTGGPPAKRVPLTGNVSFFAFPLVEYLRNGRLVNEDMRGGETAAITFQINKVDVSGGQQQHWNTDHGHWYTEPKVGKPMFGLPSVEFDVLVVKNNDRPLWVPVVLNDIAQAVIKDLRESVDARRRGLENATREFAAWQTPAKRAERRAGAEQVAKLGPEGVAFIKSFDSTELELERISRAQLVPGGPLDKPLKDAERELRDAQGVLDGYAPDVRTSQACYDKAGSSFGTKYRPLAGAPATCEPIVKDNFAYFDPKLPRYAPQLLWVTGWANCYGQNAMQRSKPGGCPTNQAMLESLDWNAVRAWLDR